MAGNPMARFGTGQKDDKKPNNPMASYGTPPKPETGKGNPVARFGRPQAGKAGNSRRSTPQAAPVSAAAQEKADRAKASARRYAEVQRAANKAKRAVLARKGPQDLAGRTQRDMDLKRMRELQKGADKWKDKARSQGLRFGGDKPGGSSSGGSSGGRTPAGSGGGSTAAGRAVSNATSGGGGGGSKSGGKAPKIGAVLTRARKMKQETTGTPVTAKELNNFIAYYNKTHKGTLSRSDAVLMARMLKSKSPSVAKKYGLNVATEN